jgi:uncharacterized protein YkwD
MKEAKMRHSAWLWISLLLVALLTGCPGGGSDLPDPGSGVDTPVEIQNMLARHNATRASLGLGALAIDSRLAGIAQQQAEYMLSSGNLSHTDGSGGTVGDRATAARYDWTAVGENIARTASGASAYEAWLASSGHYANITDADYADAGIGLAVAGSVQYWCVVFGHE